jgi:hypothetical protein
MPKKVHKTPVYVKYICRSLRKLYWVCLTASLEVAQISWQLQYAQWLLYCHVYEVWLLTGLGLMTGLIGLFDTRRDYTLQFTITHTSVHSHVFTAVAW